MAKIKYFKFKVVIVAVLSNNQQNNKLFIIKKCIKYYQLILKKIW
jgi:hypothetical protein